MVLSTDSQRSRMPAGPPSRGPGTAAGHLDYLAQQDRHITLPLRIAAVVLLSLYIWTQPPTEARGQLIVLSGVAWVTMFAHAAWSHFHATTRSVRVVYLGLAFIDTVLIGLAVAVTGGVTSAFLLAIPLQIVRIVKGLLGAPRRIQALIVLVGCLAWIPPTHYLAAPVGAGALLVRFGFLLFLWLSLQQLVRYLDGLYATQARLVDDLQHVQQRLEANSDARLQQAYVQTLEALSVAIALRDNDTEDHSQRVVAYSLLLATQLKLEEARKVMLHWGALLHDLGKLGVPDAILRKPAPLNEAEWEIMRRHPIMGYDPLRNVEFLKGATPVVLHHHERWDGRGYPDGLKGAQIPQLARIFAVADAFDAMTSDRPYRKGLPIEEARRRLATESGRQFCPTCVAAFLDIPPAQLAAVQTARSRQSA